MTAGPLGDDGAYTMEVTVVDSEGESWTDTYNFTFDSTAPVVTINSPTTGSPSAVDENANLTVDFDSTDANTPLTYTVLINGTAVETGVANNGNNVVTITPAELLAAGIGNIIVDTTYNVAVKVTDNGGTSTTATQTASFDRQDVNDPPKINSVTVNSTTEIVLNMDQPTTIDTYANVEVHDGTGAVVVTNMTTCPVLVPPHVPVPSLVRSLPGATYTISYVDDGRRCDDMDVNTQLRSGRRPADRRRYHLHRLIPDQQLNPTA